MHKSLKKKEVLIPLSIIVIILLIIFGAKILLFINFLVGNDIVIKLEADKEILSLKHNEKENIKFKAAVTTNPFCHAICNSNFEDISNNKTIEEDTFRLNTGSPIEKEFTLEAKEKGAGKELYRFNLECWSDASFLCHTDEAQITTRTTLITLNYDLNDEEKLLKDSLKINLTNSVKEINKQYNAYLSYSIAINKLNKFIVSDNLLKELFSLEKSLSFIIQDLKESNKLWYDYNYNELETINKKILLNLTSMDKEVLELKTNTDNLIKENNKIVDELTSLKLLGNNTSSLNIAINVSNRRNTITEKRAAIEKAKLLSNETNSTEIINIEIEKILVDEKNESYIGIEFSEPPSKCCVFGECQVCKNNPENYPVIFLHGHAVSKDSSAEFSLEGFNQIQKRLEQDNYLNAGTVTLYTKRDFPEGLWESFNTSMAFRASYYFDIFEEPENYVVVQTKSENIDTYSIRLKELVDTVKLKTGKSKVDIVAFSMGGLVTRRYIQIFGAEDINKVILIGTPNNGIEGDISTFCSLVGEDLECRDMKSDSLFMNKLNKGLQLNLNITNIIGTGCKTNGKMGDGAVLEEKAFLEEPENHVINGTCRSLVKPLHLELRNIDLYPEVYDIIINKLKEK